MRATLLVELLTEELPPKSLATLSEAFAAGLADALARGGFLAESSRATPHATPRRLAVSITEVLERAPDEAREVQGPPVGAPEAAVAGFARKQGVEVAALARGRGPKGELWIARVTRRGESLDETLADKVQAALKALPIPKLMRWGDGEAQFVRPVHALVLLHGERVVPGTVLGVAADRVTRGHRFLGAREIALANADEYATRLADEGRVIADFAARRAEIERQLAEEARRLGASLGAHADLLDEVTALVELPAVYAGAFDPAFLDVPQECLILTMRQNQKYFPLFDAQGRLTPRFLIVSNMRIDDPRHIVDGNQRVVRPRLEDARFFYTQDRRERLETRVPRLAQVVYHNRLGSQLERVERVQLAAGAIARRLGADVALAQRAAWLAKADLLTGLVGEFPELQGTMGRHYALHDGEPREVAEAIEQHYRPRFAGDALPEGGIACAVALADKLDAIAGLFSIGQQPTGDKDPFALRRAALGIVRILVEGGLPLSLRDLAVDAFAPFESKLPAELQGFVLERLASYLRERGFTALQIDAVLSKQPTDIAAVPRQLEAVRAFQDLPEAESLAAANKRVANILRQAEAKGETFVEAGRGGLREPAELALYDALQRANSTAKRLFADGDYAGYLTAFAVLKAPVDAFFDTVMVMTEDASLRRARLALLRELRSEMNRVADISRLAT